MSNLITADANLGELANFIPPPSQGMGEEKMREIRVASALSETEIPQGHFYIVDFNKKDASGRPKHIDIGQSIVVNVLRNCMKMRKWDSILKKNTVDSTEFRSYNDIIVLYNTEGDMDSSIIAALPYRHNVQGYPRLGGKDGSLKEKMGLSIKYSAYVMYEGEVMRMNYTATDNSGAGVDDKPLPFGEETENSFMGMVSSIDPAFRDKLFLFDIEMNAAVKSKKLVLKTFKVKGAIAEDKKKVVLEQLKGLYSRLSDQMWKKFSAALTLNSISSLDGLSAKIVEKLRLEGTDTLLYGRFEKLVVSQAELDGLPKGVIDVSPVPALSAEGDLKSAAEIASELFTGTTQDKGTGDAGKRRSKKSSVDGAEVGNG